MTELAEMADMIRSIRRLSTVAIVVLIVAPAVMIRQLGWAAAPMVPMQLLSLGMVYASRQVMNFAEWRPGTLAYFARTGRWTMERDDGV